MGTVLDFIDLKVAFGPSQPQALPVVHGIDFSVESGEIMGLVGESGSGKSVTCLAALNLAGPQSHISGKVRFDGKDLVTLPEQEMSGLRGRELAMISRTPCRR